MSSESRIDRVRAFFDAFNADRVDDRMIAELFDPGVEVFDFPDVPDRQRYEGLAGVSDFLSDLDRNWRETTIEVAEMREVGDTVVVLGRQNSVGAAAGVPVSGSFGETIEFSGPRVTRIRMYRDHASALEAAGA